MKNILILVSVAWLFVSAGCRTTRTSAKQDPKALSYLALGDSYTIGESVEEPDRYPNQLAAALKEEGISVGAPTIIARTGWTTADLQQGIAAAGTGGKTYDLVTLLIGVNNEYQHRSIEEYTTEFRQLLQQAIGFAAGNKAHVLVISIPDYGYTPYGSERQPAISQRIDAFNAVNRRIADSLEVAYADITPISRKGMKQADFVAPDGLHPSGKQYGLWVDEMKKPVAEALK